MKILNKFKKEKVHEDEIFTRDFIDTIVPSIVKFYPDYFISGNTFRSVWSIREYPTTTEELAILRYLGERENITLKITLEL